MMAAMDTAGCNIYRLSRQHALVLVVLTLFGRLACGADSGLLCYSCTNVPHPRDCNRIVRCGSSEACSVESFVTPSGTKVYNMGCSSQLNCQNSNSPPVGRRESMLPALKKRENIRVCMECCHNNSFCNRELCDTKVNLTGKLCMQCADVVSPQDCATVALCQAGEICYTESITIHGENRYRLGCVKETSCRPLAASETITTLSPLLTTCGICCKRDIENCNLELCDQRGGIPPKDAVQMYLVDPPIDTNGAYCHDQSEVACSYIGAANPNFCDSPSIKNQLCPKFCGTCIPSPTLAPVKFTTDGRAPTTATLTKPPRDSGLLCYSCTNVPHPRDCNRIVRCRPSEACSVESFVTPSGTTVYYMGCSSQLNCQNSNSPPVGRRESMLPSLKKRGNILVCKECCQNNSFCNRELCDIKVNLTGKLCMQCDDVVRPQDCDTVGLCQAGEICYTESITIHGENRYRLGCVKETSCRPLAASEAITTLSPLLTTCGICCKRDIENCNLELCDQRGGIPSKDAVQMYLVDPPIHTNGAYCHDHSELACTYLGANTPNFCDSPSVKNQLCPKFCGTCNICVDSANFICNSPDIKGMICHDRPAASNYCRKTCGYCDMDVVPFNLDSCGDPIKEPMCKRLHDDLCLCDDKLISSVLCPHYCANQCGPVNRTTTCPEPSATLIGRRHILN